jgi:iron(III) transport system ATP-binding protein
VGQADFLTAVAKNDRVETELGHFSIEGPIPRQRLSVMIRPDDIGFTPDDEGDALIIGREFLGSENLYSIRLGSGQMVRSSQPSMAIYHIGQKVSVKANLDHIVVFPSVEFEQE